VYDDVPVSRAALLGPAEVRRIAADIGLRPSKTRGQNFVIDANTVRRIVRVAEVDAHDVVLEVGPGLGSLTLALLPVVRHVHAVEIEAGLAEALPRTVAERAPAYADRLTTLHADAMSVERLPDADPTALVANLPYNVAVPVLLHLLSAFPSLRHGLVMVQSEVADRLAAQPGSRTYGAPTVKASWFAELRRAGSVSRTVFWPVPNVDSALVAFQRRKPPAVRVDRADVFDVVDAAFGQRRKTLRSALAAWAGSAAQAEDLLRGAKVDPSARAEQLTVSDFARIAVLQRPATGHP
jgi:16S rRNA (adenine1518-N6/adenine1519-N6)-dimethyltransferase